MGIALRPIRRKATETIDANPALAFSAKVDVRVAAAPRHRENSTVFAIAGVGASLLPLATGGVSTWAHSLRAGLGVPLAAAVVMMVVVMVSRGSLAGREEAVTEALMGTVGEK